MPPMPLPPSPVRLLLALLLCLHPALRGTNIPDPGGAGEEDGCEERRALLGEEEAACGGCEPCGGDCAAPGSDSARLGSVNYRIGVARSGHTGLAPLRLCVSGELPSPSLASPQGLRVLRPTGGRLSPPAESADGSLEATVTMQDGSRVSFRLPPGSPVGLPQGRHSATDWRLEARAADGSAAPSREGTSWYALRLAGRPGHFRLPAGGGPSLGFVGPTGREEGVSGWTEARVGGVLRQVSGGGVVADVTVPPGSVTEAGAVWRYRVALLPLAACGEPGPDGVRPVPPEAEPLCLFTVSSLAAPEARDADFTRLRIVREEGGSSRVADYAYEPGTGTWTLSRGDGGAPLATERLERAWSASRDVCLETRETLGPDGAPVSRVAVTLAEAPWGPAEVRRDVHVSADGSAGPLTTRTWLYADAATAARHPDWAVAAESPAWHGRVAAVLRPDGSWERRGYDAHGRPSLTVRPWLSLPWEEARGLALEEAAARGRAERLSYEPVSPDDTPDGEGDARPRTVTETALGQVVSRVWHIHSRAADGGAVHAEERAAAPWAAPGDAGNPRTVREWHPGGAGAAAGRLRRVLRPGGLTETLAYEEGDWDAAAEAFAPRPGGPALRVTALRGTAAHPGGVPLRSSAVSVVRGADGQEVLRETLAVRADGGLAAVSRTVTRRDARGRAVSALATPGGLTEWEWECCGLSAAVEPDGTRRSYARDALGRAVAESLEPADPDGEPLAVSRALDAAGRVLSETVSGGGLSAVTLRAYDLAGRTVSETAPGGRVTLTAHLDGGRTVAVTRPGGAVAVTSLSLDGSLRSVTGDAQVSQHYDYGVNRDGTRWELVRLGAPDSPRWTRTTTDMLGRVVLVERPGCGENAVVRQQNFYDAAGRLVRVTRTGQADTLHEYDELGEPVRTGRDADGNGTLDLASDDRVTETVSAYVQDDAGDWWRRSARRIYATANSAAPTTVSVTEERLTGHPAGAVSETRETDVHGNVTVTTVTVDRAARTVVRERLSPGSAVAERQVTVNGLVTSVRSRSGLTTAFGYDGLRRRVSVTDPRRGTSTVAYNQAGQVSAETDAAGNTTAYGYDNAGRLAWKRNALGQCARYAHNARGQLIRVWGDTEYPVEHGYDQYGQRVTMTTFRTGSGWDGESWPEPAPQGDTTTWSYDAATGLLISKAYADGHGPSYAYTEDGRLATRTWARKDAQTNGLVTTYSYNHFGELTGIDYSDTTPDITYSYNRVGKLSQVTDAAGTRTFAYSATLDEVTETITGLYSKTLTRTCTSTGLRGRRQGLSVDNVPHYSYGYDQYGRMDRITIPSGSFGYARLADSDLVSRMTRPNGVTTTWSYETDRDLITQVQNGTVSTYGYANDAIGRRVSMSRSGSAHATPDVIAYTYNGRGELTGAQSSVDAAYSYSYSYDPIGNRIAASEAGVPWTYTTNGLNQYTSATASGAPLAFAYDLDGSMTYRPVDGDSGWAQLWNGENRLVETHRGTDRLTFKYDYMGRRVERCVYSDGALVSKTHYVYDGFKCVEELDGLDGGAVVRRHAWQPSDVGPDVILATTNADGTSYFLHDANKSVMQATGGNGEALGQCAYAPFGEPLGASPARIGFSSELFDASVRLAYYNYRHLAPGLGRWLGRDAIGEEGGVNLYAFVNNNVINNFDAQGNKPYQARDRIDEKRYYISNHKCYDRECVKERTKSLIVYLAGLSIPTATSTASDFLGFIESTSAKIISRTITFFGGISCIIGIINFDTEGPCEVEMARCQKQNRNVENNDPDRWVFE